MTDNSDYFSMSWQECLVFDDKYLKKLINDNKFNKWYRRVLNGKCPPPITIHLTDGHYDND